MRRRVWHTEVKQVPDRHGRWSGAACDTPPQALDVHLLLQGRTELAQTSQPVQWYNPTVNAACTHAPPSLE